MAVIAEGIGSKMDPEELAKLPGVVVAHDPYGHIRLGEIPLATILRRELQRRFAERGENLSMVESTLGYELRSAVPIPFDVDYTRTLGYGAVRFLLSPTEDEHLQWGGLVCLAEGHLSTLAFQDLRDPATGRTRVRTVDIGSDSYLAARKYMIRLNRPDLADGDLVAELARAAGMPAAEFRQEFGSVV